MDAIRWQGNSLALLDQTRLPVEEVWNTYTDYRKVADAIRRLVVRGAPAIGVAAAYALCLAAMEYKGQNPEEFQKSMAAASAELAASRPTAVNLFWALDRMGLALGAAGCGADALPILIREAEAIHREDVAMNRAIGAAGAAIVPHGARILTHCNAGAIATGGYGTALGVVRSAFAQGKVEMVYCDETRPLLQGARLTAWELVKDGIPATLITDNMAASLMAQGKIDLVLLGCDRMAANGDFANKIGTYGVAVLAHYHGIPFYSVLPSSTIDLSIPDGSHIPIEQREASEVTHFAGVRTAPEGVGVYNPAFDVTPHRLLTGIITEKGVIHPPFAEQLAERFG
ncbi:S-methyl-5-thioribose-1-phosphate isomerase [Intestinimonas sp.]|uniref:S-methyl-5-thioribose-1-phosphate isomerase n=1 Tax=Intestinimonas sp. TaxID=1965293 RepID=UPI003AABC363